LPFQRMNLQQDGSWKPVRFPLPLGEVRDIPKGSKIHVSALRRMVSDPGYRPGNLIDGAGGRGKRKASRLTLVLFYIIRNKNKASNWNLVSLKMLGH